MKTLLLFSLFWMGFSQSVYAQGNKRTYTVMAPVSKYLKLGFYGGYYLGGYDRKGHTVDSLHKVLKLSIPIAPSQEVKTRFVHQSSHGSFKNNVFRNIEEEMRWFNQLQKEAAIHFGYYPVKVTVQFINYRNDFPSCAYCFDFEEIVEIQISHNQKTLSLRSSEGSFLSKGENNHEIY